MKGEESDIHRAEERGRERGGGEGSIKYLPSFQSVVRFAMFHEGKRALSQSIIVALVDTWVPV